MGGLRTTGHHGDGNCWSHSWAPSHSLLTQLPPGLHRPAQVRGFNGTFCSLRTLLEQFRHLNFDQNFYRVFCLNTCQIQNYSLPPSVLCIVLLPEAQLGVYELLGSCHLMVTGCWRNINLTQSIFSRCVFIYSENFCANITPENSSLFLS